jgi:hypothetical protein
VKRTIRRPSPAMVVGLIALLAALSGTATALPGVDLIDSGDIKNGQVQRKDIGKNAVNGAKVANGALSGADVRDGSLTPSDFSGSVQGPKGDKGDKGDTGQTGPPGPFPDQLPSGKTLRGHFGQEGYEATGAQLQTTFSFIFTLPSNPTAVLVPVGGPNPDPAHCPGSVASPSAAPGFLCLYERQRGQADPDIVSVDRYGFEVALEATNGTATFTYSLGTWAVTAP